MQNTWYHLGIDGGGTHCRARLYAPNGTLIGQAKAGPANARLDSQLVEKSLRDVTSLCLNAAGIDSNSLLKTKVGIGLAGVLSDSDADRFSNYCSIFPYAELHSDSAIACLGAHNGDDGAILVTGTGTSAMLIQQGVSHTICSWGFRVADQASGAQMGLLAIRTALKAHDGIIKETKFSRSIMKKFDHSPSTLVDWSETATPGDFAKLAPHVIDASNSGDSIARAITDKCFADFRDLLDTLIAQGAKNICLSGGLSGTYHGWLSSYYHSYLSQPVGDPIDGAILIAKKILPEN